MGQCATRLVISHVCLLQFRAVANLCTRDMKASSSTARTETSGYIFYQDGWQVLFVMKKDPRIFGRNTPEI